jgi:hypothetical protein
LNQAPQIAFCEDLTPTVRVTNKGFDTTFFELFVEIAAGQLRILPQLLAAPSLLMEIPATRLRHIAKKDASWD